MPSLTSLTLPDVPAPVRRRAVARLIAAQVEDVAAPSLRPDALRGRLPDSQKLRESLVGLERGDESAGEEMHALLELSWIVASADGLEREEAAGLAEILGVALGDVVSPTRLLAVLEQFAATGETRTERIERLSRHFDDFVAREEALAFAGVIAMADGKLAPAEARALVEVAEAFDFSVGELHTALSQIVARLVALIDQP